MNSKYKKLKLKYLLVNYIVKKWIKNNPNNYV